MNWLPHFLTPLPALIAAAIALPLLLLLYFLKLRRRELPISSTLLWKKAVRDLQVNSPFQRLRRNLLLLLQLLLLFMLLLAMSRPVARYTPGAGNLSVVLIDHSASMNATDLPGGVTRLDEAKRRAKDFVSSLGRNGQAMLIAFADESTTGIVQPLTGDISVLKRAIDSIQPTDCKSKLKLAFQLADAQSTYIAEQNRANVRPDVRLYSDGRILDIADLQLHGDLKYECIGSPNASNIGIVALDARRSYENPVQVQVFARLANFGPDPLNADVQLSVDGAVRSVAAVSLAPDRWNDPKWNTDNPGKKDDKFSARDSVRFEVEMPAAGIIKVEQKNREHDCLAADDSASVVVPPPKTLSVLLVTDGNYFLERGLSSLRLNKPATLTAADYEAKKPADFDVIIFDRHTPAWEPTAGNFIYFGCLPPEGKSRIHTASEDGHLLMVNDVSVLDWKRDHPILRHLSFTKLYAATAIKLDVPPEVETLIDGTQSPLVVLSRESRSTHLVVAFDVLQSNWPLKLTFPIFLNNAMQYLALGSEMNVRPSQEPGVTPRLPRANLERLGDIKTITLDGPGGAQKLPIPVTGDFALPALTQVGVYRTSPPVPQFEQIAVNLLDENESNVMPVETPPGNVGVALATAGGKSRLELWWWLVACGALPLLMIEWWVYTRRVHL